MNPQNQDQPVNPSLDNDTTTPVTPAPVSPVPEATSPEANQETMQGIDNLQSESSEPKVAMVSSASQSGDEAVASASEIPTPVEATPPTMSSTPGTQTPASSSPLESSAAGVAAAVGAQAAQQQATNPMNATAPESQPVTDDKKKAPRKVMVVALVVVLILALAVVGYAVWQSLNAGV